MSEFSESNGVVGAVDDSEIPALSADGPAVPDVGAEFLRGRAPEVESPFSLLPARNEATAASGSSVSPFPRLSLILLRIDPLIDLDDPCVSDLMIGKVPVPSPREPVEPRAEGFPLSPPDLLDGCCPMTRVRLGV
jgi:hypothetical protein